MKKIYILSFLLYFLAGCSNKSASTPPPVCNLPVISMGKDQELVKYPGYPDKVTITGSTDATVFKWEPTASNALSFQVAPDKTTQYKLTAINSCGQATGTLTVHVYKEN